MRPSTVQQFGTQSVVPWLAQAGLWSVAAGALEIAWLHPLNSVSDLLHDPVSFYVHGPHGWLLTLALIVAGVGTVLLSVAMAQDDDGNNGAGALALVGVAGLVSAAFPSDLWMPWERPLTVAGSAHMVAVCVAALAFPVAAWRFSRAQRGNPQRRMSARALDVLLRVYFAGGVVTIGTLAVAFFGSRPLAWFGLVERISMVVAVTWLVVLGRILRRRGRSVLVS